MLYIWLKSFHIIAMVAWFAGLFYLPRLFVYHADANDDLSVQRFELMERRLYYTITWPAGIMTTVLGLGLLFLNSGLMKVGWMHAKLLLITLLWMYHLICGKYVKQFQRKQADKTSQFFRVFNEIPTLFLVGIVILAVVKPF